MKQRQKPNRLALGLLLAAAALPITPSLAQETAPPADPPIVDTSPPPVFTPQAEPAPDPVATTPPVIINSSPAPSPTAAPPPVTEAPAVRQETPARRTTRATTRAVTRTSRPAPVRTATAEATPASTTTPVPEGPLPIAAQPPGATAEAPLAPPVEFAAPAETSPSEAPIWPWMLAGAALLLGALAFLLRRRRRADVFEEEIHDEPLTYEEPLVREEPVYAPAPVAAAAVAASPLLVDEQTPAEPAPAIEELAVADADQEDVDLLAATSEPVAGRPWLEFLMRPVRAGTNEDGAVVEFELTVGNTGTVQARDVRISTWMFAAGSPQDGEMERMLIEPSPEAALSEVTIDAGDATRVEATIALPKTGGSVLPVVVADARYRLPDGSEGRTTASFAVGLTDGEDISPFSADAGLHEDIGSRLHGELQRA